MKERLRRAWIYLREMLIVLDKEADEFKFEDRR